jgi:hypothetical protein
MCNLTLIQQVLWDKGNSLGFLQPLRRSPIQVFRTRDLLDSVKLGREIGDLVVGHGGERLATSVLQNHPHADRLAERNLVAGELEFAGILIDAEYGHIVGLLVGSKEKLPGGVDAEVSRSRSPGRLVAKRGQLPVLLVDPEHGDAVVAAVRAVEKLAAWVNENLGGAVSLD